MPEKSASAESSDGKAKFIRVERSNFYSIIELESDRAQSSVHGERFVIYCIGDKSMIIMVTRITEDMNTTVLISFPIIMIREIIYTIKIMNNIGRVVNNIVIYIIH